MLAELGVSVVLETHDQVAWQRLGMYRNLDEFRGLKSLLAPELARCFSPVIHEGLRRPYCAIVGREESIESLGTLINVANPEELRAAADGMNTSAYVVKGASVRLLRLSTPIHSQETCSALAAIADGVLVRVDGDGIIWVASAEAVTTIDDKGGWTRPAVGRIVPVLSHLAPTAEYGALNSVAGLAYSLLGPHKIGTTLLYSLTNRDQPEFQQPGIDISQLGLSSQNTDDWPIIQHQLKHVDGAAVIDRNGRLLRKGVILNPSPSAVARVRTAGGTRHNSACRHTYDRPDLLAFVVSADGPITIFSDGASATSLVLSDRELPWNPSGGEMWIDETHCPTCGVKVEVRKIILYGWRDDEEGECPVCNGVVGSVHGWKVEVGLIKDASTLDRISAWRQRQE